MSIVLIPEYVIDIQNVVAVLIVEPVVLEAFAWFRKDSSWVS